MRDKGFYISVIGLLLIILMAVSIDCSAAQPKMRIKPGARIYGIKLEMRIVLREAADIWEDNGQTLVITSVTDSIHSPGSMHYYGYGVDFRTRYFDKKTQLKVYQELRSRLSDCFIVLLEYDHMHVHILETCIDD